MFSLKGVWRSRSTAILPGSKWSCQHLRTVLQDALSEVKKVYPPLKLRGFVDDVKAFMEGRNKELPGIAEKVLKAMRMEVEGEGFEDVDHGRGKGREEQCSKREGVGLATRVETLRVWLRTRT